MIEPTPAPQVTPSPVHRAPMVARGAGRFAKSLASSAAHAAAWVVGAAIAEKVLSDD